MFSVLFRRWSLLAMLDSFHSSVALSKINFSLHIMKLLTTLNNKESKETVHVLSVDK